MITKPKPIAGDSATHERIRRAAVSPGGYRHGAVSGPLREPESYRAAIGVDPGVTGAMCILEPEHGDPARLVASFHDIPVVKKPAAAKGRRGSSIYNVRAIANIVRALGFAHPGALWCIEDPAYMGSAFAVGQLARCVGVFQGAILASEQECATVRPRVWKKDLGLGTDKRASIELATALVPIAAPALTRLKDHNRAEALLIAWWYRHTPDERAAMRSK